VILGQFPQMWVGYVGRLRKGRYLREWCVVSGEKAAPLSYFLKLAKFDAPTPNLTAHHAKPHNQEATSPSIGIPTLHNIYLAISVYTYLYLNNTE